ncbi:MAG TPA: tetratricopeptide repeat protein [Polyangiaceae bacterium]|nr:tetratricopeptide repeat protein [Polyangiaceae bacterium]
MPDVNKRLAFLEHAVKTGTADSFARYALGMEYRNAGRVDDAVATFTELRAKDPGYLPMYLMVGQLLTEAARKSEAIEWLEAGIVLATERSDGKALGELESALGEARDA